MAPPLPPARRDDRAPAADRPRRRPARRPRRPPAALACALALLLLPATADATGARGEDARPSARAHAGAVAGAVPVTVAINPLAPGPAVPQRFLGLSFEAAALTQLSRYGDRGNLVSLLRSLGPGMLRFGGITADENVAWTDAHTPRPAWASSMIGPAQMHALGVLARRSGWQVLLTVGLAHFEPLAAAREVAAAHRALGANLAAVEIGNEPNSYGSHGLRELPWLAQAYEEEVSSYRQAIDALTPGVPIAGPDVSGSGIFSDWGEAEALTQQPALLTGHHYPLGCVQTPPPSIELLLSDATRGREARSLTTYMSLQRANRIPVRIDEANTVSCGGVAGISNTFASALWATGYITQAMAAGTAGINLQGNPKNCPGYTPLCTPDPAAIAAGALSAEPEWYALLLTSSLVGTRPLPSTVTASNPRDLAAASFLGPERSLKVVLVDDEAHGAQPLAMQLQLGGARGSAQILRLSAPAQNATSGVLLGGHAVAADGVWSPPARAQSVPVVNGTVALRLPADSAALVTVTRAKPAPRSRHRAKR